jgi:hypothetical protein
MTSDEYTFWQRLNVGQRDELAGDCRSQLISTTTQPGAGGTDSYGDTRAQISAFTPVALATAVTVLFRDPSNAVFDIQDACEEVVDTAAQQQDNQQTDSSVTQMDQRIAREDRVLAMVKHHTFTATNALVSAYMKADAIGYAVRGVACLDRAVCTVAYDDVDPEHHPILSRIFGSGVNNAEFQLVQPMTELFNALFSDPKLERATVTSWIDLQTVGGKVVLWPALTISCDRHAADQIDWSNVSPAGLNQLCAYSVLPQGRPS